MAIAVGTREALDLAQRLAEWHDAMVMHRRRAGEQSGTPCDLDCPHEQAELLWLEARDVYGERAREFAFLRSCQPRPKAPAERRPVRTVSRGPARTAYPESTALTEP